MTALLSTLGLYGLFLSAFLAGSVVPLPSEALLVALLVEGAAPVPVVLVATVGNTLGAATLFWLGGRLAAKKRGRLTRFIEARTGKNPRSFERARLRLLRYGAPALLFAWIPLAGDLIVIAAGFAGMRTTRFLLFVSVGKSLRFLFVTASTLAAIETL